jgi:hypothetical protein
MPSTVIVQSLITLCTPNLLSKTICVCGGGGGGGGEDKMLKRKTRHRLTDADLLN